MPSMRLGAFAPVGTASHMGKSLRPHQASDPQPLSRQSPFGTLARMRRSPQGANKGFSRM
ncbi:MAG: hypothetical protein AAFR62_01565 [Cyanobacteria bacterium J06629_2]